MVAVGMASTLVPVHRPDQQRLCCPVLDARGVDMAPCSISVRVKRSRPAPPDSGPVQRLGHQGSVVQLAMLLTIDQSASGKEYIDQVGRITDARLYIELSS
jgi:hypothetical protein